MTVGKIVENHGKVRKTEKSNGSYCFWYEKFGKVEKNNGFCCFWYENYEELRNKIVWGVVCYHKARNSLEYDGLKLLFDLSVQDDCWQDRRKQWNKMKTLRNILVSAAFGMSDTSDYPKQKQML